MRISRYWAAPLLAGAALTLAACGSSAAPASTGNQPASNPSTPAASSGTAISTRSTALGTVLVNAQGHTVYWFAKDTATTSYCTGSCSGIWPPVPGPAHAASGASLTGSFGTITRSNGQTQATYDGHPLYTYTGDTSAGMTTGNGLNVSGGLWWAITPAGTKPASQPSSSPSTGYGY